MIINCTRQTQSTPLNFRTLTTTNIILKTKSTAWRRGEEKWRKRQTAWQVHTDQDSKTNRT